ncbi:MAG: DoxX family protein [Myxococcaceae bacterium]|nr:DoxX family protein [Myxococcaceae bacterium]
MLTTLRARLVASRDSLEAAALFLVRLSAGIVFAMSGWGKLHNLPAIIDFFTELGIPYPSLQAPFVSGLELVGGLLLIAGLFARLISLPLIGTMVVAMVTAKASEVEAWHDVLGFIEWHYLAFFAVVALMGPGKLSLDHLLTKKLLEKRAPVAPVGAALTT